MPTSKHLPPRTRGEMVDDLTTWMDQRELVVLPADLAQDLMRCAMNGTEANPDWRAESISVGRRALELRQQRDDACASLVKERADHEATKAKLAQARQQLREMAAAKEDDDGRKHVTDQGPRLREADRVEVPGAGLPG